MCGALSPRGRLTEAAGRPGDALVMCPAEGDSLGAAKDLAAGPVSLPAGIETGNILPLMASDSRLNCIWVLKKSVVISGEGTAAAQQVPSNKERTEGSWILNTVELGYLFVRYCYACVRTFGCFKLAKQLSFHFLTPLWSVSRHTHQAAMHGRDKHYTSPHRYAERPSQLIATAAATPQRGIKLEAVLISTISWHVH